MINPLRRSRAKNLNAPEHWLAWLRAGQKDPDSPLQARGSLGALTGTDMRVMGAIAAALAVRGYDETAALEAVRALLPVMQAQCWPFARELFAQQGNWEDRDTYWPLVVPGSKESLIALTVIEPTAARMHSALLRLANDYRIQAISEQRVAEFEARALEPKA
jgi:hypothetical protein